MGLIGSLWERGSIILAYWLNAAGTTKSWLSLEFCLILLLFSSLHLDGLYVAMHFDFLVSLGTKMGKHRIPGIPGIPSSQLALDPRYWIGEFSGFLGWSPTAIQLSQGAFWRYQQPGLTRVSAAGLPTVADEFGQSKCKNFCENLCGSMLSQGMVQKSWASQAWWEDFRVTV